MIASAFSTLGVFVLEHEREGLSWPVLRDWVQSAGGFAALGLLLYLIATTLARRAGGGSAVGRGGVLSVVLLCAALAVLCYVPGIGLAAADFFGSPGDGANPAVRSDQQVRVVRPPTTRAIWAGYAMTAGGAFALLGFAVPFLADLPKFSLRRILAIAKLTFKEAVRRRILWGFLLLLLLFLFPPKWFFPIKPEDEVRTNVTAIFWAMPILLILAAVLLASFGIPNDLKNQTIHTIVTKPVEKFEIVFGRFLGVMGLMTLVLAVLCGVSLVLLQASNVSEEARGESFKARIPVFGNLSFRKGLDDFTGESVGREWEYRRYIAGGVNTSHRAVWSFRDDAQLRELANLKDVTCEFSFDIFRTTKGEENKGVFCSFQFVSWQWGDPMKPDPQKLKDYQDAVRGLNLSAQPGDKDWDSICKVASKFGYYEFRSKEVVDYHTFGIVVPAELFKVSLEGTPPALDRPGQPPGPGPRVQIWVKCDSRTQFLGVAKYDLYLLAGDAGFSLNFFKGAFGLWLVIAMATAIAVACSTYLSGIISFLVTIMLLFAGLAQEFIQGLADGSSVGGGPAESLLRLAGNKNITVPLDPSAAGSFAQFYDGVFRWVLRRFLNVIPDVDRFNWSTFVAEGFNVAGSELVSGSLILFGYLLLWGLLAYYLMKSREVAN
ncbi:MAG: hypothetical protein U0746_11710 [Gemmataceae bacterium]